MNAVKNIRTKRSRRAHRVRARIHGTRTRPRLTVFRSNRHLSAQLIDDEKGVTLCAVSSLALKKDASATQSGVAFASVLGRALADAAKKKKIDCAVFDRGAYRYHGRVKAFADAAREGGLQF